jgi:hypothetical protein
VAFTAMSAHPVTSTVTSTSTSTTSTRTVTQTVSTSTSSTASFAYLTANGGCAAGGKAAPCWGGSAYIFNCLSAAETQQGCAQLIITTLPNWNYTINIRYPFSNQSEPSWANCLWSVQGEIPGQGFAYCSPINSTSFTIGEPVGGRQ